MGTGIVGKCPWCYSGLVKKGIIVETGISKFGQEPIIESTQIECANQECEFAYIDPNEDNRILSEMERLQNRCGDLECSCSKPRSFWVEMDSDWANPTGNICWAYYPEDRPTKGSWIKVSEVQE